MPRSYRQKGLADKIFDLSSKKSVNVGCVEYVKMAKAVAGNDLGFISRHSKSAVITFLRSLRKLQAILIKSLMVKKFVLKMLL